MAEDAVLRSPVVANPSVPAGLLKRLRELPHPVEAPETGVAQGGPGVAIFDFDRTLIHSGSLLPILRALVGRRRLAFGCVVAGISAVASRRRADVFRAVLLRMTTRGRSPAELEAAAERAFPRLRWRFAMLRAYARHQRDGRVILVASGGLAPCVRRLLELKGLKVDDVLATELDVAGGRFTGRIDGLACTGAEKARRVRSWLGEARSEVWGYGNLPADGPMLALTRHPTSVGGFRLRRSRR